jgi:peroxiredoxin
LDRQPLIARNTGAGKDRLFEGDPAPTDCFEDLVSIKSENAIGSNGKQRLVPWLRKSSARHNDYLVLITDPRMQSPEFRESVKSLTMELPEDIRSRMVVINADSPAENRRWLKKSGIPEDTIELYSDEKMEWMRSYTALGENRWSMTMFVIRNGRVQKLARDVDQYGVTRTVRNAVKALDEARL